LIGSWQENAPSNWTILSGYVRFTLHGDCAAATVNVEWNRQQIGQVSGILHIVTLFFFDLLFDLF